MLKLKLQYFGHLMRRTDSLEKTLMLGKIEGRKRREQQRMGWLDGITDSMDMEEALTMERTLDDEMYNVLKSTDITLLTKVCKVKSMVFPVVMYRCESCTIKKAEH